MNLRKVTAIKVEKRCLKEQGLFSRAPLYWFGEGGDYQPYF
jgi:hypothetical protein